MTFPGFPDDAFAFYAELVEHNERAWWLDNRTRYDEQVRAPFEALVDELGAEFGPLRIFRPYRDVRFSVDKRPYKEQVALATRGDEAMLYLQLNQEGLMLAGGYYRPSRDQLARFRELVDDIRLVGDLEATLEELAEQGFTSIDSDALVTAPRGYPRDHPRIGLLRLRNLAVWAHWPREPWMHQPAAFERLRTGWRTMGIWNAWLRENIGPASGHPPLLG